ncbi:MAG TPA: HEAT repeat domain-containing protein [Sumerlaeia bacterium]|nr:HEAT repeat domain-containing protein [Sumerlaeia bacterium]
MAADTAPGNIRPRVEALLRRLQDEPKNEVLHLQLAHLYAQIWIATRQVDAANRALKCLERAVDLESGQYTRQIHQLFNGINGKAKEYAQPNVLVKVSQLNDALKVKLTARPPAPSPPELFSTPPRPEPTPAAAQEDIPAPEIPLTELRPGVRDSSSSSDPDDVPEPRIEMEVTTIEEEISPAEARKEALERQRQTEQELAVASAESIARIAQLFDAGEIVPILQFYAREPEARVRRRVAEKLIERIPHWRVDPVLAAAALEGEEQVFRLIMRLLLKGDRSMICQQIDLDSYSTDLKRVAVTILSELGVRSALPKLEKALESGDAVVRSVAAHGIGKMGPGAAPLVGKLIEILRSDANSTVRLSAARAIQATNLRSAYEALEQLSGTARLDGPVYGLLEELREKYGAKERADAGKSKKKKGKKGLGARKKQKLTKGVLVLLVLVVLGYLLYNKFGDQMFPPSSEPPPQETPAHDQ